jgi:hypothetical protein
MLQYQRDRAWAMNQIARYELNQFQILLYRFAEVPEYERHNAPDIGIQSSVGLLDCDQVKEYAKRVQNYERLLRDFFAADAPLE